MNYRPPLMPHQREALVWARRATRGIEHARQEQLEAVIACRRAGVPTRQIGEWIGVTGKTVWQWCRP